MKNDLENIKQQYWHLREVLREPPAEIWRKVAPIVKRVLAMPQIKLEAVGNRARLSARGMKALPPAPLRQRVSGEPEADIFINKGRRCYLDIVSALRRQHRDVASFKTILDFGCGCGRTLLWWEMAPGAEYFGTDIDAEAIRWCQENHTHAQFGVNDALPPLQYADDKFDLIYAVSILTHINEEFQFCWLEEFRRITKPGGLVLLTLHGDFVAEQHLNPELKAELKKKGILFLVDDYWKTSFPEWYQSTFHTQEYVMRRFAEYFKVIDYIPRGMNQHQDIVMLQKP